MYIQQNENTEQQETVDSEGESWVKQKLGAHWTNVSFNTR